MFDVYQIRNLAVALQINERFVEKDWHVVQAIAVGSFGARDARVREGLQVVDGALREVAANAPLSFVVVVDAQPLGQLGEDRAVVVHSSAGRPASWRSPTGRRRAFSLYIVPANRRDIAEHAGSVTIGMAADAHVRARWS